MEKCDCDERIGVKINSMKLFEELKSFFKTQEKDGIFSEVEVTIPYYIGRSGIFGKMKWFADKWYRCNICGTLWEVRYPDFPACGFVRKYENGIYTGKEVTSRIEAIINMFLIRH